MSRDDLDTWLQGPVPGVPESLMPVAHTLLQVKQEAGRLAADLAPDELWARPGGYNPAGFHLLHLAGSLDRLLSYARGEELTRAQREALERERRSGEEELPVEVLVATLHDTIDRSLEKLRQTPAESVHDARAVGAARLPATVGGILYHAAEHSMRHLGQLVTTVKILRGLRQGA